MAHAGLVSLAQTIDQLLNHAHSPIDNLPRANQESIMCIRDHTLFLQSSLPEEADTSTSLEGHIREVANAAEDVIDDLLLDHGPRSSAAGVVDRKLKRLVDRFESTTGAVMGYMKNNSESSAGDFNFSSVRSMEDRAGLVVGFKDDLLSIQERIIKSSSSLSGLQVLPIVGMGGIGKTTLAKLCYQSALAQEHFDVRGWVTVSQDYSVASVVSSLVASMKGSMKFAEGVDEIQNYLRGKRYLVVVDDMWSKKAWDDVRKLLPDNDHGSAIILTTRNQDVAVYANHPSTYFHTVQPLHLYASWDLLQHWVFGDQRTCPTDLERIGKEIAAKCRGLPLSITVVGGLLSRFASTYMWKRIAKSSVGQVEELISLSYTHLPHHLKSCFLYMGGFPEDYQIHASELIGLWVAEGFVNTGSEDEAEGYLEDLIDISLVLCSSRKFDGKAKCCSLHDIVRDFCIRQGRRDKLLVPVMDYLPTPILRRHFLSLVLKNYKRISTTCSDLCLRNDSVHTHASRAHSIICIPHKAGYKRATTSVGDFSLLRVLHVLRKDDYCDWEPSHDVFDLVYLTYLASNIPSRIVPPAISKLQNLHTLILYKSQVLLPVDIWGMKRLRHLIAFSFRPLPHPGEEALPLENLQSLTRATDFVCSERMVQMIPNVRKLGICYSAEAETEHEEGYLLENLTRLLRLEELKLEKCTSVWPSRRNPVFPKSLKKLVLSGGWLSWRDMTKLVGWLPSLQVLKLKNYACEGGEWETSEGGFVSLRVLVIDESYLQHWTSDWSHFPELKCLMLHRCPHLSEIPTDFGDIPTLKLIEIDGDNQPLLYSAKMIQEEQMYNGNDGLQVRVKRF